METAAIAFSMLVDNGEICEVIKMHHSYHHVGAIRHPKSSYVQTTRTELTVDVCRPRRPGSGHNLVTHAKVADTVDLIIFRVYNFVSAELPCQIL